MVCLLLLKVFLKKMVNIAHGEASRMKLNKEELVRITLVYQRKFNGSYLWIKNDLSGLKSDFSNLDALENKSIERLNHLRDLLQRKEGTTLMNTILGGNV